MVGYLVSIVGLHKTMRALSAADQRLESIPDWMSDLHLEHQEKQRNIDAVALGEEDADRNRREAEAGLSDAHERLKQYQEQIGRVSTQREYGALLKEIDTVKEQIQLNEQIAIEALEQAEEARRSLTELQGQFTETDERYQVELEKWESEKPSVVEAIAELRARCKAHRDEIPKPQLALFDRIYDRYTGQAIAEVHITQISRGKQMWHCAECSYSVRPQIVIEIRNEGNLNQCDSCKRILYLEDSSAVAE